MDAGRGRRRSCPSRCASTSTSTPTSRPTTSPTSRRRSTCTAGSPARARSPSWTELRARARGPLRRRCPSRCENLITLQQARIKLGQAGARAVTFRGGRLAVTPIELDSARRASGCARRSRRALRVGHVAALDARARGPAAALPGGGAGRRRAAGGPRARPRKIAAIRTRRYHAQPLEGIVAPLRLGSYVYDARTHDQDCSHRSGARRLSCARVALVACGAAAASPATPSRRSTATPITKTDFDHWMTVAAKSGGQAERRGARSAGLHGVRRARSARRTPKPAKGQPKVTDAQLKTQCKQEYDALRDQVCSC